MVILGFFKKRPASPAPKLRARSQQRVSENIDGESPEKLHQGWAELTARSCYFELKLFTLLSNGVEYAPNLVSAEGLGLSAGLALRAHHDLAAEIIRSGEDPVTQMERYRADYDEFFSRIESQDWYELVLSAYLVGGILADFHRLILDESDDRHQVLLASLRTREQSPVLREVLYEALESDPKQADRLALWGRRLVGDALLICRRTFPELLDERGGVSPELQVVLTEVIAQHTRRMDSLGLTA